MKLSIVRYLGIALISLWGQVPNLASGTSETLSETVSTQQDQYVYLLFGQPFIVNLKSNNMQPRYLRIDAALKLANEEIAEQAQKHLPRVRHALILLLSEQHYDDINSIEGKRTLKRQALHTVRSVFSSVANDIDVEDIYFTKVAIH